MSTEPKRPYHSKARQEQSALTQKRILKAAKKLFQKEGFEAVTIEKIALLAEVSVPTIYALFQSKRGLLLTLMDQAYAQDRRQELVSASQVTSSPSEQLRITAKISRELYDAEHKQLNFFRGAGVLSPEFKKLENLQESRRYERQKEGTEKLYHQKVFKKGLTLEQARDIIWAFTGRDFYRLFVLEKKWSSDAYEQWLGDLLIQTLLKMES